MQRIVCTESDGREYGEDKVTTDHLRDQNADYEIVDNPVTKMHIHLDINLHICQECPET